MKPGVFIQATAGTNYKGLSSFIFDKAGGRVCIEILLNRIRKIEGVGEIYLLFSDEEKNREAISWAKERGLNVIAGSEDPFLRLLDGCGEVPHDHFVRIPGEYILLNPSLTDRMIRFHLKDGAGYTRAKDFPLGMLPPDIFSKKALYEVRELMKPGEEGASTVSLFKKYGGSLKTTMFCAEGSLLRKELSFSLECRDDLRLFENTPETFDDSLLDPEEQIKWLGDTRDRIRQRANDQKYEFRKLTLSVTNRCNLKCKMCAIIKTSPKFSLSEKCLRDAIQFGVSEGFSEIEISGGEPLTLDYLPGILAETETGPTSVKLVTNGVLLDDTTIEMLAGKNIIVQVSIDGVGDSHDDIRGACGAYKKTIVSVQKLIDAGVRVAVHSVIQKGNVHQIYDLFRLFYQRGLEFHSLALVERMEHVHAEDLDKHDLSLLDEEFHKIIGLLKKEGRDAQALRWGKLREQYGRRTKEKSFYMTSGDGCNVPYRSVIVNPDGSVLPCWHHQWGFPEEGYNLNRNSLSDIVYSPGYRERIFDVKRGKCPGCNTVCYGWDKEFAANMFS